jgi:hypothetical protein
MFAIIASGPLYAHPQQRIIGTFIERYDPDYDNGVGRAWFTNDPIKAKKFKTQQQAKEYATRVSTVRPWAEDRVPNRPLPMEFQLTYRYLIWRA